MTIKKFILNPLDRFQYNLVKENKIPVFVFPLLYGTLVAISLSLNNYGYSKIGDLLGHLPLMIITRAVLILISCFIYSWIVLLISLLLKGLSNINYTFSLVSYSLIPLIIGALIFLILKLIFITANASMYSFKLLYKFIYYFQHVFNLWTIYLLIIGNAMINDFSKMKSIIACAGIITIFIILSVVY
ncbi:YIP1 family protein [Plebeiibacterium sediminum]|uniref:YIP1 family protein n=1 Tax=Plebeiibacterium sediminum TaxID=2992112 RepID=A0AAE3M7Y3_9BACT|nr:YIP1 family protein [Plebeiobacterium sediminum]MCW3788921.1 YIP1 family protein [Plebeiobacterium sediminum]